MIIAQFKNISKWLIVLILFMSIPAFVAAQQNVDQQLAGIDEKVDTILFKQRNIKQRLDKYDAFSKEAERWFKRFENVEKEIFDVQQKVSSENYTTYEKDQILSRLNQLKKEQASINHPPSGININGNQISDLTTLQSTLIQVGRKIKELKNQYNELAQQLNNLDIDRDRLVAQSNADSNAILESNNKRFKILEERYNDIVNDIENEQIWCEQEYRLIDGAFEPLAPICRDRRQVIRDLVVISREEAKASGLPLDPKVLADRIAREEKASYEAKDFLRNKVLPVIRAEAAQIQKENQANTQKVFEIAGCWKLSGDPYDVPVLDIRPLNSGGYDGIITSPGYLAYQTGHRLFTVARINATTFDGTEFSFKTDPQTNREVVTRIALRLIVDPSGRTIGYRTRDDIATLSSCR